MASSADHHPTAGRSWHWWPGRERRPLRTPTVLQLEAAECGAASLAMVLGHHGLHLSLERLRALCGVSRDGSKASSLLRAARSLGLTARGLKAEPHHLRELPMPAIAFIDFNHFVVVEGLSGETVFLNDPAEGPRRESLDLFAERFTGVLLCFTPGPDFRPQDDRLPVLAALVGRLQPVRAALWFAVVAALALVVPGIVLPAFSRAFVDQWLVRGAGDWLPALLIGMAVTALLRLGLLLLQGEALVAAQRALNLHSSTALMETLLRLPISFFEQRFAGEIADRLRLNERLGGLLTGELIQAVVNLATALFFLVIMLAMAVPLTLAVMALALANAAVLALSARLLAPPMARLSIEQGKLGGARIAGLRDMESFKASGAEDVLFGRWTGLAIAMRNSGQQVARLSSLVQPLPPMIAALITALVLVWGGFLVMQGRFTLGDLVAYQTLAASFSAPVLALAGLATRLAEARNDLARIDDLLEQPADPRCTTPPPASLPALPGGALSVRSVSFGYAPLDPPLIDNLSLDIRPGMRVALVGPSGSGKSTFGKLLAGLENPRAGTVCLDGRPLLDWPRDMLAQRLACVRQDIMLFGGSVRDNLALWDAGLPEAAMIGGASDAAILGAIAGRPGGFDAQVAEGGRNFSGGERQRLEIARALASDPAVLILDEATSALDPPTEEAVLRAIRRRGITCILIAHRLSAIRDCDLILVMDRGQVVEQGDHAALMAAGGLYRRLVEA